MKESEFEAELRSLKPVQAGSRLAERIAAELASGKDLVASKALALNPDRRLDALTPTAGLLARPQRSSPWSLWPGLGWALGGAAVAVAVLFVIRPGIREQAAAPGLQEALQPAAIALNEEPDESVDELIEAEDEGLVYDSEESQPQRQVRLKYLERHTWTNSESGAVIEFEVPREDVVWMPVAMQ
jgi:hypothetical protein